MGYNKRYNSKEPRKARWRTVLVIRSKLQKQKLAAFKNVPRAIPWGNVTWHYKSGCDKPDVTNGSHRHAALVYRVHPWYWTSMLWSIDTCQNKVSADQYNMTISQAQVYCSSRSRVLLKLTADQVLVIDWIAGSYWVSLFETGQDCSEAGLR